MIFPLLLNSKITSADNSIPLNIGVIAPLSGSSSAIGEEIARSIEIVKLQENDSAQKYNFKFILEDGKAARDTSPTTAAKKLIALDLVNFLITATSGETLQVAPLAEESKIVTFAVYSGHPQVKYQGRHIFRTFIDTEKGIALLSARIRRNGDLPFSLLTEEHAFNIGIKSLIEKQFKENEIYSLDYPYESLDLRTILLKSKSSNPKSVYLNCATPQTCSVIVNQTRQLGIKLPIYSYLHMELPEFLENTKSNAEGIFFLALPNIEVSIQKYEDFLDRYEKKFGFKPKMNFLSRSTFDAIQCIFDSIESKGANSEAIIDYLAKYIAHGALGEISFDENGDIKDINYVIKMIKNGRPILVN